MERFELTSPVVVVSSHLDDAVLSCGDLLFAHPSTTVLTVFAGAPPVEHVGYNSRCTGKSFAPDAMVVRRQEDRRALEYLGATPVWLDLFEEEYASYRPTSDYRLIVRDEIARVLDDARASTVFAPLGLIHPDHRMVSDACVDVASEDTRTWYAYLDLPYGLGGRANRWAASKRRRDLGRRLNLIALHRAWNRSGLKVEAMAHYSSQVGPTRESFPEGYDLAMQGGEEYWRLRRRR